MQGTAIVVGAGPAGLAAANRLTKAGVATTVLERADGVADRWRNRYDGLRLNTMRQLSSMPGRRIPRSFGRYPKREDFVAYLEDYARPLDVRFGIAVERVDRSDGAGWRLDTSDGPMDAPTVVVATGWDAEPTLPTIPGLGEYYGELIHAVDFRGADGLSGKRVLIVGAGNTGIDIAGLLDRAGAEVTVAMRTPPNLFPRDMWGVPLGPGGIAGDYLPARFGDTLGRFTQRLAFGDLTPFGVPRAPVGMQTKYRAELTGAAVDDGFVAGLKAGRIKVRPTVARFEPDAAVFADDSRDRPDLVICATGYRRGLEPLVGHLGTLRPAGRPSRHNGAADPATPGLFFAGFHVYPTRQLGLFASHARRIARAATSNAVA